MKTALAVVALLALTGCRPSRPSWDQVSRAAKSCARYETETNSWWECLGRFGVTPQNCDERCTLSARVGSAAEVARELLKAKYFDCMQRLGPDSCNQQYEPGEDWPGYRKAGPTAGPQR